MDKALSISEERTTYRTPTTINAKFALSESFLFSITDLLYCGKQLQSERWYKCFWKILHQWDSDTSAELPLSAAALYKCVQERTLSSMYLARTGTSTSKNQRRGGRDDNQKYSTSYTWQRIHYLPSHDLVDGPEVGGFPAVTFLNPSGKLEEIVFKYDITQLLFQPLNSEVLWKTALSSCVWTSVS